MQTIKALYTATATATGGRDGRAVSSDGFLDVKLTTPRELGGQGGEATNPEQLFAAGYAACFESAVCFVAREQKVALTETAVTAQVGVGPRSAGGFGLTVALKVALPGVDRAVAEKLVAFAHENICPYSHATRGNVDVSVTLA